MGDLLGEDFGLVQKDKLYRCMDKLLEHKNALFSFLQERWQEMFDAKWEGESDVDYGSWCSDGGDTCGDAGCGESDLLLGGDAEREADAIGEEVFRIDLEEGAGIGSGEVITGG